mgnify:CR=1 FL=1
MSHIAGENALEKLEDIVRADVESLRRAMPLSCSSIDLKYFEVVWDMELPSTTAEQVKTVLAPFVSAGQLGVEVLIHGKRIFGVILHDVFLSKEGL